jgi:hypothetical protein
VADGRLEEADATARHTHGERHDRQPGREQPASRLGPCASLSLPALRTSLQRMAAIARALECADSAAAQARDRASLVSAHMASGQILETEGLVCDALEHYAEVLRSAPGDKQATLRAQWVVAHLRDPQRVDRFAPPEAP